MSSRVVARLAAVAVAAVGLAVLAGGPAVGADDPPKVSVAKGKTFSVTLPKAAGTNYDWKPTKMDEKLLTFKGSKRVKEADKPGGPEEYSYTFEGKAAGTTLLELGLLPLKGKQVAEKVSRVEVTVK